MDYDLLQRHGATNIEYEEPAVEPWLSPIGEVGDAGIYNIPRSPKVYRVMFELNAVELGRLEFALRLLEEEDTKAAVEAGPYGTSCWDAACDEDIDCVKACDDKGGWDEEQLADGEWDEEGPMDGEVVGWPDEAVDKAPMPAHYKYILRYR